MSKQLRIVYTIGPEDVIESYKSWKKGEDTSSQVSMTFSGHFYEVCTALNAFGYVIAEASSKEVIRDERFIVERRPLPFKQARGVFYHLRQILRSLQLFVSVTKFGANVVIADSGTAHWFTLLPLTWMGIKVIPSLQCTLWRKYSEQTLGEKIVLKLSRSLFRTKCHSIHAVSHDVSEQVSQLTGGIHRPIHEFLPMYRKSDFAGIAPPSSVKTPFRILFAGRVEYDKGAFDLLQIAKLLKASGLKDIVFDICGDGTFLPKLQNSVQLEGVGEFFVFHGYCIKTKMREMFGKSHAVIVPTRTDFIEGFNRVVAESILSGRPVITSAVCPALSYVYSAVMEVPPNDIQAYAAAIQQIYCYHKIYEQKRLACLNLQQQFYDFNNSWATALTKSLSTIE